MAPRLHPFRRLTARRQRCSRHRMAALACEEMPVSIASYRREFADRHDGALRRERTFVRRRYRAGWRVAMPTRSTPSARLRGEESGDYSVEEMVGQQQQIVPVIRRAGDDRMTVGEAIVYLTGRTAGRARSAGRRGNASTRSRRGRDDCEGARPARAARRRTCSISAPDDGVSASTANLAQPDAKAGRADQALFGGGAVRREPWSDGRDIVAELLRRMVAEEADGPTKAPPTPRRAPLAADRVDHPPRRMGLSSTIAKLRVHRTTPNNCPSMRRKHNCLLSQRLVALVFVLFFFFFFFFF